MEVTLRSTDGVEVVVDTTRSKSSVINEMMEFTDGESGGVIVPVQVRSRALRAVIDWMQDEECLKLEGLSIDDAIELASASDYLQVDELKERTCKKIAEFLAGKTTKEMREIMKFENDFTPEEEQRLGQSNLWQDFDIENV
jgi:hypothetical protein